MFKSGVSFNVASGGACMNDRFVGRNVDLRLLTERLILFFLKGNSTVVKRKVAEGWEIIVNLPPRERIVDRIAVSVTGSCEDFSVKFIAGSHSRMYKWVGQLTTMFGGGIVFSKGFESELALEKLERNFWVCVDETVESLAEI
jgi:hypothetical protein